MLINQRFTSLVSLAGVGGPRHQKILFKNFYINVPDGQGRNKFCENLFLFRSQETLITKDDKQDIGLQLFCE